MSGEYIVMGGSMYGKRAERIGKDCYVYLIDHTFRLKSTLRIKEIGPCFEVRLPYEDR